MNSLLKHHLILLFVLWVIVHLILFLHFDIRNLFDANIYISRADFLIANGRLQAWHHIIYGIPIILIAVFRWLIPNEILPFLIFQCIVSGIATTALYRAASKIFNNNLAGLLCAIIFLLWLDNIHWNITAMTESLMCSFISLLILKLTDFKGTSKDYFWITFLLMVLFFTRPTAVIIIIATIAFLVNYHWNIILPKPVLKFSILAGLLIVCYISADLMFAEWDFTEQYVKGNIVTYMDHLKGSSLYYESLKMEADQLKLPDSNKSLMKILEFIFYNPIHFIKSAALKVWYLVIPVRPYYSLVHNIYSISWICFIYLLFYFGWKNNEHKPIKIFIITVIIINCFLIALSTVDWDNRFYIPMEPGIVLLSGGGAAYLFNYFKSRTAKD